MKFPAEIRKYMRGKLMIKVWYEQPSMKCKVEYGVWSINLPREITELRNGLRGIMDYEDTQRTYKIITMEVNDMLREYYLNYNCSGNIIGEDGIMAEQFHFPEAPTIDTRINTYQVANGQVNILSGATGPIDYVDRHVPHIEYLSDEEYQEKRRSGELESGTIYCVLN